MHTPFALLLVLLAAALPAAEITISPASGQDFDTSGVSPRVHGSPIRLLLTLSAPATITPSITAIDVLDGTTSVVSDEFLTVVANSSNTQWIYQATPLFDGTASLTIAATAFGTGLPSAILTQSLILDRDPVLSIPAPGTSGGNFLFVTTITSGLGAAAPAFNNSFVSLTNGELVGTPVQSTNIQTATVRPFGYGSVRYTALAGHVRDDFNNANAETTSVGTLNPPGGTTATAPKILRIRPISPSDQVYRTGDTLQFAVDFDRSVSKAGAGANPSIRLNSTGSGTTAFATTASPSGTTLVFSYTVLAGHRSTRLDAADTNSFTIASQTAMVGTATSPDFLANVTVPSPGAGNSLSGTALYSINVEASKPYPDEVEGADLDSCGVGGGVGLLLASGSFALIALRRRR